MTSAAPPDAVGASRAVFAPDFTRGSAPGAWLLAMADLEMAREAQARAELTELCTTGPARIVMQFADGAYVDVRGLSVLIDGARTLGRRGGGLLLLDPPYSLRRMIQVLDITAELGMARNRMQAESWLARAGLPDS